MSHEWSHSINKRKCERLASLAQVLLLASICTNCNVKALSSSSNPTNTAQISPSSPPESPINGPRTYPPASGTAASPTTNPIASPSPSPVPLLFKNGVYLGHSYAVNTQDSSNCSIANSQSCNTFDFLSRASSTFNVFHIFLNLSLLSPSGIIVTPPSALTSFLSAVARFESANHVTFLLYAVLGFDNDFTSPGGKTLDISNRANSGNLISEIKGLVQLNGKYVQGAPRSMDGVMFDIEPMGTIDNSDSYFQSWVTFLPVLRAAIPGVKIGMYSPVYNANVSGSGGWRWNSVQFYTMAGLLDVLSPMSYDSGLPSGTAYQAWMQTQTTQILQAVSGELNANGPLPINGVKVLMGLPAEPNDPNDIYHDSASENMQYGIPGLVAAYSASSKNAKSFLGGATMYAHTTGNSSDGYASYQTDWANWVSLWVKANLN